MSYYEMTDEEYAREAAYAMAEIQAVEEADAWSPEREAWEDAMFAEMESEREEDLIAEIMADEGMTRSEALAEIENRIDAYLGSLD